jgi:hypothetical protein
MPKSLALIVKHLFLLHNYQLISSLALKDLSNANTVKILFLSQLYQDIKRNVDQELKDVKYAEDM